LEEDPVRSRRILRGTLRNHPQQDGQEKQTYEDYHRCQFLDRASTGMSCGEGASGLEVAAARGISI